MLLSLAVTRRLSRKRFRSISEVAHEAANHKYVVAKARVMFSHVHSEQFRSCHRSRYRIRKVRAYCLWPEQEGLTRYKQHALQAVSKAALHNAVGQPQSKP